MRILIVTLAVASLALASSCGGASQSRTATSPMAEPAAAGDSAEPMIGGPKQEIDARSDEIQQLSQQIGLAGMADDAGRSPLDPSCPDEAIDECVDVCTVGDSICANADRICELAGELAGDTWAADKCDSAKQTCRRAKLRCCDCNTGEHASRARHFGVRTCVLMAQP